LLWGDLPDTILAYQGLRQRGFEKQIVIDPQFLRPHESQQALIGAFSFLPSITVDTETQTAMESLVKSAYKTAYELSHDNFVSGAQGAALFDALSMTNETSLTVLSLGIGNDTQSLRNAMNDLFLNSASGVGVNGRYDFQAQRDGLSVSGLTMQRLNPQ